MNLMLYCVVPQLFHKCCICLLSLQQQHYQARSANHPLLDDGDDVITGGGQSTNQITGTNQPITSLTVSSLFAIRVHVIIHLVNSFMRAYN